MLAYLANALTVGRLLLAVALLFLPPYSVPFYIVYACGGLTDLLDGPVARRTHSESRAGERLDSLADLGFLAVCLVRLLPGLALPLWLWLWVALVAAIKLFNLAWGLLHRPRTIFLHTTANRVTGLLLFLTPFALPYLPAAYPALALCAVATFAAVQEGYCLRTRTAPKS